MTNYIFILNQTADAIRVGIIATFNDSQAYLLHMFMRIQNLPNLSEMISYISPDLSIVLVFLLIIILILTLAYYGIKRKSRKKIRPSSRSQQFRLKQAKDSVTKIISKKHDFNLILKTMDGFTFEIFVLEALRRVHKNISYIDNIKLTNDGGIDGAFSLNGTWYIVQSKHYKGSVSTKDIELIGKKAEQFNASKHKYAKKLRKKYKYHTVQAIFATSGNITSSGLVKAKDLNVFIIHSDDLVISLRTNKQII